MTRRSSFLQSWWFYVGLSAIVALLYGWLLRSGSVAWRPLHPATTDSSTAASHAALWDQDLDPQRMLEVLQRKPRLAIALSVWTALGTGLGIAGLALSVLAIRTGQLARLIHVPSRLSAGWSFGDLGRVAWLIVLLGGLFPLARLSLSRAGLPLAADAHLWSVVAMLLLDGLVVAVVWALASSRTRAPAVWFGLSRRTAPGAIKQALTGYVGCFPWIFGLLWLVVRIANRLGIQPSMEAIHELLFVEGRTLTVALTVVLACVIGPVAEEVFFRGVVFATLRRSTSRTVAMLVSGSLFAAMHTNLIAFVPILALGCVLAHLYERSGSLVGPIAVHMVHNTFLVGLGLTARELL
ncbi:MAG: CPBP family intramembrane metalloprotease [Candidatus Omnitrophica bacterium]|nr:CPBP family intramembrane metalloprotease [Candidatus Omnitrophota bacterium]